MRGSLKNFARVEGRDDLVRDMRSRAVLNVDDAALAKYRADRDRAKRMLELDVEVRELRSDVGSIRGVLDDILQLLKGSR